MSQPLAIIGCGAITAVGYTSAQTCAAIRAAVAGFTQAEFQDEVKGPTLWAAVPLHPGPMEARPFGRLVFLAITALQECVVEADIEPSRCALLLGARESFRIDHDRDWTYSGLLSSVQRQLGVTFHNASQVFPDGNSSGFAAIARARELLTAGVVTACIVGGVDSFLNVPDLVRFGSEFRLKSDAVAQGFIPGEAAAFVAVTTPDRVVRRPFFATVCGVGLAREEEGATVLSDGYPLGRGLGHALTNALADAKFNDVEVAYRVSDQNGETYRGQESMLVLNRVYRTLRPRLPALLPAACVGETGAAVGALMIIVAVRAMTKGYSPGRVAMCEASSDGGLRAGCIVSAPGGDGNAAARHR